MYYSGQGAPRGWIILNVAVLIIVAISIGVAIVMEVL